MECKKLRNLLVLYILFLAPLVLAAAPEEPTAEGQTEATTENTVDDELTSEEAMADEVIAEEEEESMGVTVEPGTPFEVPALIDRPLDIEEGPYVVVNSFSLIDVEDYPQHDVSISEINDLLEGILKDQPERGFSIGEMQEVADEVTRYYLSLIHI